MKKQIKQQKTTDAKKEPKKEEFIFAFYKQGTCECKCCKQPVKTGAVESLGVKFTSRGIYLVPIKEASVFTDRFTINRIQEVFSILCDLFLGDYDLGQACYVKKP